MIYRKGVCPAVDRNRPIVLKRKCYQQKQKNVEEHQKTMNSRDDKSKIDEKQV